MRCSLIRALWVAGVVLGLTAVCNADATWFTVNCSYARLAPEPVEHLPATRPASRVRFLVSRGDREIVAVVGAPDGHAPRWGAVRIAIGEGMSARTAPVALPTGPTFDVAFDTPEGEEQDARVAAFAGSYQVTSVAAGQHCAFLGTAMGPIVIGEGVGVWLRRVTKAMQRAGTLYIAPGIDHARNPHLSVDHDGNLWISRGPNTYGYAMPAGDADWQQTVQNAASQKTSWPVVPSEELRLAKEWEVPHDAIAGAMDGPGLWVYASREGSASHLCRVAVPEEASTVFAKTPLARAAVPAPSVQQPLLAADRQDRVYLAGDTLDGSKVFVFDGETIEECSPPSDLLRGRRFTALLVDAEDHLHAATDGVGVLVYDGDTWREHPINEHLPTVAGTGLKPVTCMTFDRAGNLWVGMDNNVICWREEE